jgi:hypothetical protein
MKELILECTHYEYSQEYFNLCNEAMEVDLLLHQLYVTEHADQISSYYMESGYFLEAETDKESLKTKIGEKLKKFNEGLQKVLKRINDAITRLLKGLKKVFNKVKNDLEDRKELSGEQIEQVIEHAQSHSKLKLTRSTIHNLSRPQLLGELKRNLIERVVIVISRDHCPKALSLDQLDRVLSAAIFSFNNIMDNIEEAWQHNLAFGLKIFSMEVGFWPEDPEAKINNLSDKLTDFSKRWATGPVENEERVVTENDNRNRAEFLSTLSQITAQSVEIYTKYMLFSKTVLNEVKKL